MKIAAAYVRVSTDGQLELSPDSQIKAIREYAKKNGYILPDEYIKITILRDITKGEDYREIIIEKMKS